MRSEVKYAMGLIIINTKKLLAIEKEIVREVV